MSFMRSGGHDTGSVTASKSPPSARAVQARAEPDEGPPPPHALRCLKSAGTRSVWLVHAPGEPPSTVKSWPLSPAMAFKLALGLAQPQRHRRAARALDAARIPTPRAIGRPRVASRGAARVVELRLEFVEGRTALEVLRSGEATAIDRAGEAVGGLLAALVVARLFNRDLKLSNVLIADDGASCVAWLLDPVGVRRMADPRQQTARMLERLAVEPREARVAIPRAVRRSVVAAARRAVEQRR